MPANLRRKPRQARSIAIVDAIIEGAARVFDREGLDATTNRIAVEAGVSVGSVYQYFADKQALLDAVATRHLSEGEALLVRLGAEGDTVTDVETLVRTYVAGVAGHHARHPHVHTLYERHVARTDALLERVEALQSRARDDMARQLSRLRPDLPDPRAKAALVVAALGAGIHQTVVGSEDPPASTEELVQLCLAYLCRPC